MSTELSLQEREPSPARARAAGQRPTPPWNLVHFPTRLLSLLDVVQGWVSSSPRASLSRLTSSTQPSTSSQVQSDCCLCCPGPGIVCLCRPLLSCRVPVTRCGVNCVFSVLCAPRHPIQPKSPENWTPEATTSRSVLDPGLSDRASPHTETHNTHLTNRTVLDQPSPDRAALALTSRPRT